MSQVHTAGLNVPDGSTAAVQCVRELDSSAAARVDADQTGLPRASAADLTESQIVAE